MLYFSTKPDEPFNIMVKVVLAYTIDELQNEFTTDEDALFDYLPKTKECFSRPELILCIKDLLQAHISEELFRATDYHFLVLYDLLDQACTIYNADYRNNDESLLSVVGVGHIDFESLIDIYFWDTDFLFTADEMAAIPAETKKQIGFNDETFGLTHGLKPHPEELHLEKMEIPVDWLPPDYPCPPGAAYPYFPDDVL